MELWIRTQNRENLVKPTNIRIIMHDGGNLFTIGTTDNIILGTYTTATRARQILDEIQRKIVSLGLSDYYNSPMIDTNNNLFNVYEMPEE